MKAGHQALPIVQCTQRIDAALKADLHVQIGSLGGVLLQHGQGNVMTGSNRQQLTSVIARVGEDSIEIGT